MSNSQELLDAIDKVADEFLNEVVEYNKKQNEKQKYIVRYGLALVCICLVLIVVRMLSGNPYGIALYVYGSDQEINNSEIVIQSGRIKTDGSIEGGVLQLYTVGKEVETIRFSCKNQWISFMDYTEKRSNYGWSKNFSVYYGNDIKEYRNLVIAWEPLDTVKELHRNKYTDFSEMDEEFRTDLIVMQVVFLDGKKKDVAVYIKIDDNGEIKAYFSPYEVNEKDSFVLREDISSPYRTDYWWATHYDGQGEMTLPDKKEFNDLAEEQFGNIMDAAEKYYDKIHRKIISVKRVYEDRYSETEKEYGYSKEEVIFLQVEVEGSEGIPRFIAIGSKDGWQNCVVLNEGY